MRLSLKLAGALALVTVLPLVMAPTGNAPQMAPSITCSTACDVTGMRVGQVARTYKTAVTSRASVTAVSADPDLQFTNVPAGVYLIQCLTISWNTSGVAVGYNFQFSSTGTLVFSNIAGLGAVNNTAANSQTNAIKFNVTEANTANGTSNSATDWYHWVGSVSTSTAGTIAFQWAQFVSTATATNMGGGSWCELRRVG